MSIIERTAIYLIALYIHGSFLSTIDRVPIFVWLFKMVPIVALCAKLNLDMSNASI